MSEHAEIYTEEYYLGLPVDSDRIKTLLAKVELDADDNVCEIGCAAGHFLAAIAPHVSYGVGIDTAAAAIRVADRKKEQEGLDNIEFATVSAEQFAAAAGNSGRFDLVFLMDVSEHIDDPTLIAVLNAAHRLLNDDGRLIVHTPNLDYWLERMKQNGIVPQLEGHIAVRNASQYRELFINAGFVHERCSGLPHYRQPLRLLDSIVMHVPLLGRLFESRLYMSLSKRTEAA